LWPTAAEVEAEFQVIGGSEENVWDDLLEKAAVSLELVLVEVHLKTA
jgi:hypothetical protein